MTIDYSKLDFGNLFKTSTNLDYSLIPKTKLNNFDNFCFDNWMEAPSPSPLIHKYHCDLACKEVQYPGCVDFLSLANNLWQSIIKDSTPDSQNYDVRLKEAVEEIYSSLNYLISLDKSSIIKDNTLDFKYLINRFYSSFKPERLIQEFIDFPSQEREENPLNFNLLSLPANVFPGYKNLYVSPVFNCGHYHDHILFSMSSHYLKLIINFYTAIELMLSYSPIFCKVYKHAGFNWIDHDWENSLSVKPINELCYEGTMLYRFIHAFESDPGFTKSLFNNGFETRHINYNETPLTFYSSKFKTYLANLGVGQVASILANPIIALKMFTNLEVAPYKEAIKIFLLQSGFTSEAVNILTSSCLFNIDLKVSEISTSQKVIDTTIDFHKSFISHFTSNVNEYRQLFLFLLGLSITPKLFKISNEKIEQITNELEKKEANSYWAHFQSIQTEQLKNKLKSKVV